MSIQTSINHVFDELDNVEKYIAVLADKMEDFLAPSVPTPMSPDVMTKETDVTSPISMRIETIGHRLRSFAGQLERITARVDL